MLNRNYADNRFMQMGVIQQMNANSWEEARSRYENSCMMCCTRGVGAVECAHCPIREAMLSNATIFRFKLTEKDKKWVAKERELL